MQPATLARVRAGGAAKGDVLGVARIAAIQAAKRTSDLIPLCHPLPLTRVAVAFTFDDDTAAVAIEVTAETLARTGVEMEALTGAAVGLLTIYDMCKAVDRGMRIEGVKLLEKARRPVRPVPRRMSGMRARGRAGSRSGGWTT